MCGIAGIMMADNLSPPLSRLDRMASALSHRGPDGVGYFNLGQVGMVQTRLAIIDIESGDQPLFSIDKSKAKNSAQSVLIANGEIYNYIEIQQSLGLQNFNTGSDCEAALALYARYGLKFTKYLRGMYAIAIYDVTQKRLILTRDRFGVKPLYYCEKNSQFAFSSEPQALIASGLIQPKIDEKIRNELLQIQFTTGRKTIYDGIFRVLPGETIVIQNGRINQSFKTPIFPSDAPMEINKCDALSELDKIFEDAVRIHQRSDVPYGMFFSGGVDSSALLTMMKRLNEKPIETFTIGFSGTTAHDERIHANALAKAVGANHHEIEFTNADFWSLLPKVIESMDDPVADYAILPTYKMAAEAKKMGLKVVLSGEGGDEVFAGYSRYRRAIRSRFLGGRAMRKRGILDDLGLLRHTSMQWRDGLVIAEKKANHPARTALQKVQALDAADWLPNDLLMKLDRCLMSHGVEGRVPFLDPEFACFAYLLPDKLKIQKGRGKWLLRQWLQDNMPLSDPFSRKRGFKVPVGEWIELKDRKLGYLVGKQEGVQELCKPGKVEQLFSCRGKAQMKAQWSLLFYALWHQQHILGRKDKGGILDTLASA